MIRRLSLVLMTLIISLTSLQAQQRGKASYFSNRLHGRHMSDGSKYHRDSMVCANNKYPLGTLLRVTNPTNGKFVIVRVADRGPFGKGRVIDLSYGAAKVLGILTSGTSLVDVELYQPLCVPFKPNDHVVLPELDLEITTPLSNFHNDRTNGNNRSK